MDCARPGGMAALRLIADDLTGALDSSARFAAPSRPVRVAWRADHGVQARADHGVQAIDAASRERDAATAAARHRALAPWLAAGDPAFKKVDSLLRGHPGVEIAALLAAGGFDHVVIAPAFPFQGRITAAGRQIAHGVPVPADLAADLRARGVPVAPCRPGDPAPPGASLWDAASEADLARIVAAGRALPGRVLWVGTGGLAGGLAGAMAGATPPCPPPPCPPPPCPPSPCPPPPGPLLALVGSDHPTSRAQLAATRRHHPWQEGWPLPSLPAAISPALPPGLARADAAGRIARCFAAALAALPRPGSLLVAGGETLRGLCETLGVTALAVEGELEPGVPLSRMEGGRWHGLPILSKSGAFGDTTFLARLLGA